MSITAWPYFLMIKTRRRWHLSYFTKGRAIKMEIQDLRGLSNSNLSLGVLHEEKGNYQTALEYYDQSLEGYRKIGDRSSIARVYNNIGVAYVDWQKYDSAQVYHEKSLNLHLDLESPNGIIRSYMNLGETFQFQQRNIEALRNFHKARMYSEASEQRRALEYIYDKLGQVFLATNALDSAGIYLERALDLRLEKDRYFGLRNTYASLSLLEEKRRNYQKSLRYYKLLREVQDSFLTTQKNRELAEVQAQYDHERQEQEITALLQENKNRTLWRNIFAMGTLAALAITTLVVLFFRYRAKKNRALLEAEESQRLELEKLDRLKTRFFSNISHEFRTPLTLILGPLDTIRKQADASLQPAVDSIERNGKRLLKLINQLLDLSKIESGKVELKTALIDVVPLLKGWVMSFNSAADTKKIHLEFISEEDAYFLYVDQEKIEEVIINVLSNAFKYTPTEGRIKVQVKQVNKEAKELLEVSISDTGTGIPEQELAHVFDRFYQASNANHHDVTGTGIGLALVKELVELHKGNIRVESGLGQGSTFFITLPLGNAHLTPEEMVGIHQFEKTLNRDALDVVTQEETVSMDEEQDELLPLILMIEDNAELRSYIKEILIGSYRVIQAIDGEEGVAMATAHIPDIVLSDLMMPKMDGLEVCRTLKEDMRTSHIPIVILTAKSSKEDRIEGLKNLADAYLTKPFDTQELLVRLHNLIELRKKLQAHFGTDRLLRPSKIQMNSMDTLFMEKVTEQLENEISNSLFGVVELAYSVNLSRSQLFRKIKAITNLTPNEFIRSFRLYRAKDMLQQQVGTVAEIAHDTGFQNPSYFSKCFQEQFGSPPSTFLRK